MFQRSLARFIGMHAAFDSASQKHAEKKGWNDLFFKPETRDERIKQYVPDVLEESLAEQRAVLSHTQTTRDLLVEHGQKVVRELENKAPTPAIYPSVTALLKLYGKENLVTQRALNYLLYPSTTTLAHKAAPHELVGSFHENWKNFVDSVEQEGSFVHDVKLPRLKEIAEARRQAEEAAAQNDQAPKADKESVSAEEGTKEQQKEDAASLPAIAFEPPSSEPSDVTYLVKCISGMCMANLHLGDKKAAIRCCDAALEHVIDTTRKGGVLALKAGILNQQREFEAALACAREAIEVSGATQGYLQGCAALRLQGKHDEAVALLETGIEANPSNGQLSAVLESLQKERPAAEALPDSSEKKDAKELAEAGDAKPALTN